MKRPIAQYFPHLGGALVLGSLGLWGLMAPWESGSADPLLTVYADKLAGGLPTVCHGLTRHVTDTPIVVGQQWSRQQCDAEEQRAIVRVQRHLAGCFTRLPPQHVFDAASSHAWNNGARATCNSLAMRAFNEGQWELGCRRLSRSDSGRRVWSFTSHTDRQGHKTYTFRQGLANRRDAETRYCLEG